MVYVPLFNKRYVDDGILDISRYEIFYTLQNFKNRNRTNMDITVACDKNDNIETILFTKKCGRKSI